MRRINCHIPIGLRIVGDVSDAQLDGLAARVQRAVAARLDFAERALATRHGAGAAHAGAVTVREGFDEERFDPGADRYTIPAYQRYQRRAAVPLRQRARDRRGWRVYPVITFEVTVRGFVEFLLGIDPDSAPAREIHALHPELLDTRRPATAWTVVADEPIFVDQLVAGVVERAARVVGPDMGFYYGHSVWERDRRRLQALDPSNRLARLPDMSRNRGAEVDGRLVLARRSMLLFVFMALPVVSKGTLVDLGPAIDVPLRLGDLDFIVDADSFARLFGAPWASYRDEFRDQPATLHICPFYTRAPARFETLAYLFETAVAHTVDPEAAYFGNLYLLNRERLDWLPPAARAEAAPQTDEVTLSLDESRRVGAWEPDWAGAYIYIVLAPTAGERAVARYLPQMRRLADELAPLLRRDPERFPWAWDVLELLRRSFRPSLPNLRIVPGEAFSFLLAELERRGLFDRFFAAVEQARNGSLHQFVVEFALEGSYAQHPRVRATMELLNARRRGYLAHTYRVAEGEIWLDHRQSSSLRPGVVAAKVDSWLSAERTVQSLKPQRQEELKAAFEEEAQALLGRVIRGADTHVYNQQEFAEEALKAAARRIKLSESDFEEITIERSIMLVSVSAKVEEGVEYFLVTFDFVERVAGGEWVPVQDGRRTERDTEFEWLLWGWRYSRKAAIFEAFAIGVSVLAIAVIAWEVGAVALLVELAGGATAVLISIGISELIYLLRVIFGDARLTLEGVLLAALDGYLMALGFRGAGLLGRAAAKAVGTESMGRIIGGWFLERFIVGTVGGAGSAALVTFSHDLIGVLTGRGTWSSPEDYVHHMAWGALLGLVFEFGIGLLQPVLRAGGRTGLETLSEVAQRVRAAGISPAQWTAWVSEALANLRRQLDSVLVEAVAGRLTQAFRERLVQVTEMLGQEYRLAIFRRVLELSPEALSRQAIGGLEKLLNASRADLSNEVVLGFFNRMSPARLRTFLEFLNALDNRAISALAARGELEALANSPLVLEAIETQGMAVVWRLITGPFNGAVAEVEQVLTRLGRLAEAERGPALELFFGSDPVVANFVRESALAGGTQTATRLRWLIGWSRTTPQVPEVVPRGEPFARGGTSTVYEVPERPDLLLKQGGGRLPREAQAMLELEALGIDTVYAATRRVEGQTSIVVRRIEGVGSKDIIGRVAQPLRPPQHVEVVTARTIEDLERIWQRLEQSQTNIGDFQFIVRRSDGAVFVNDPTGITPNSAPSGTIRNIIDRFRKILITKQSGLGE